MSTVSRSWFISFAVHLCLAGVIGGYLVTQSQPFKDLMGFEILQPANKPPKPQVRKPVIKLVQKPKAPIENTVIVEQVKVQPRTTNAAVVRTATVQPRAVSTFSNQALKLNAPINPNVPKVINPHAPISQVVTHTDVPLSDAPDALALSSPVVTDTGKNGEHMSRGIGGSGRGISGSTVQVRIADVFKLPSELTMVKEVGAIRDALDLEGIFIGDKLSVLVIRRDYMCAMEAVSLPSRPTHYSPSVYRFMTNVAIYALTHGKISDYSGYVPEDKREQQRFPTRAPQAATIGAVE